MKSAHRKIRLEKEAKRVRVFGLLIKILIPVIIIASAFLFLKITTKYWNGSAKVSFVFQDENTNVEVVVLDPQLGEETTLIIPGDTEVNVAHGFGTLRIKNVWKLGVDENLNGSLLAQTVTEQFLFPTYLWSSRSLGNLWQFVFSPGKTNISFGDRLSMAIFSMNVKSIDQSQIDLGKSLFLKKQNLTDGMPGYTLSGPVSDRLTVYFSDNDFATRNLKFGLTDATGTPGIANGVGNILEVLGGKVVSIDKRIPDPHLDCVVGGLNPEAVTEVERLFSCKKVSLNTNFDLEVHLGELFAKRY